MHLSVHESQAKKALLEYLDREIQVVEISDQLDLGRADGDHPWLSSERLVCKPDVKIGKRGKSGLLLLDKSWEETKEWISEKMGSSFELDGNQKLLSRFIVEPFIEHAQEEEYYFSISTGPESDLLQLSVKGGVEIEEDWGSVETLEIDIEKGLDKQNVKEYISQHFKGTGFDSDVFVDFTYKVYTFFVQWGFVYLEINPLVIKNDTIYVLDLKSRVDSAEEWRCGVHWKKLGLTSSSESKRYQNPEIEAAEKRVEELDALSGSSLKMQVLNPNGSMWPLVAGGGASVLVADAVVARGQGSELGFYGEYSGNPAQPLVKEYTDIILQLMLNAKTDKQKSLIVAGGIANFTDVAKTFGGIISAFEKHANELKEQGVRVFVRRGGPNYQKGLKKIKKALEDIGLEHEVHGPEAGLTDVVTKI